MKNKANKKFPTVAAIITASLMLMAILIPATALAGDPAESNAVDVATAEELMQAVDDSTFTGDSANENVDITTPLAVEPKTTAVEPEIPAVEPETPVEPETSVDPQATDVEPDVIPAVKAPKVLVEDTYQKDRPWWRPF